MENKKKWKSSTRKRNTKKKRTTHSFWIRSGTKRLPNDGGKQKGWKHMNTKTKKPTRSKQKKTDAQRWKTKKNENHQPESETQKRKEQPIHFESEAKLTDCRTMVGNKWDGNTWAQRQRNRPEVKKKDRRPTMENKKKWKSSNRKRNTKKKITTHSFWIRSETKRLPNDGGKQKGWKTWKESRRNWPRRKIPTPKKENNETESETQNREEQSIHTENGRMSQMMGSKRNGKRRMETETTNPTPKRKEMIDTNRWKTKGNEP